MNRDLKGTGICLTEEKNEISTSLVKVTCCKITLKLLGG